MSFLKIPGVPAVGIRRFCSDHERSFPQDAVESYVTGPEGYLTLFGGPSLHGSVQEAQSKPLRSWTFAVPEDRNPEQLKRRAELGAELMRLATVEDDPGD